MTLTPFVHGAKMQTMLRDFNELRMAIRRHDSFGTEAAWEKCERWLGAVTPETKRDNKEPKLMNDIKTWAQGRYAPEGRKHVTVEQAAKHEADERHLVRQGLRDNAICHCPRPDDAAWIAKRLNLASQLEQMTYEFATGKTDGSEIVDLVKSNVN